jgi:hypothetical protein
MWKQKKAENSKNGVLVVESGAGEVDGQMRQ